MARWISFLLSVVLVSLHVASSLGAVPPNAMQLQVTTLVGTKRASVFQCWSVAPPFTISKQPGTVGAKMQSIGDTSESTIVFFNESNDTDAGLHNAPAPQWVLVLQGSGVLTLPMTNTSLQLHSGAIIIANDTAEVSALGHDAKWSAGTVALQLPFKNGIVNHTVVNDGPCACAQ